MNSQTSNINIKPFDGGNEQNTPIKVMGSCKLITDSLFFCSVMMNSPTAVLIRQMSEE